MRLAIFGGTFDPIHNAHMAVAREAAGRCRLDKVLFVVADRPPHKAGGTHASYDDRFRMVELACQGEPEFEASRAEQGTGRSYSIDTIEKLRAQLAADDQLLFLIGADAFAEIQTWRRWQDVIRSVQFIVVSRPGHHYAVPEGARVHRLETVDMPISSSAVRRQLATGGDSVPVPTLVLDYIRAHGLYRTATT